MGQGQTFNSRAANDTRETAIRRRPPHSHQQQHSDNFDSANISTRTSFFEPSSAVSGGGNIDAESGDRENSDNNAIPEGSAVSRSGASAATIAAMRVEKSPSPPTSSAPTTGTTTTPVSVDNCSSQSDQHQPHQQSQQQQFPTTRQHAAHHVAKLTGPSVPDFAVSRENPGLGSMPTSVPHPYHQHFPQAAMVDHGWGPPPQPAPPSVAQHMYAPISVPTSSHPDLAAMYYGQTLPSPPPQVMSQALPPPQASLPMSSQHQQQQYQHEQDQQQANPSSQQQQQHQQDEDDEGRGPDGGDRGSTTPPGNSQDQQLQQRYNPANYPAALKLLVSNNVAGSIIGRSGQTISELQTISGTRIKLSQTGDYYPGTQDRVCLVQGEPERVKTAIRLLLERLYMLQEHQHSQHMAWQLQKKKGAAAPSFDFVVRMLVPSSSCGMLIGKSGSNIKFLEETTGVSSVRLSPKDAPNEAGYPTASIIAATSERVVTVSGPNLDTCVQCLYLIVDGMASHPDISRYTNMTTSYSRIMPDAYIAGAPRQVLVSVTSPRHSSPDQQLWQDLQGASSFGPAGVTRRIASSPDLASFMLSQRTNVVPQEPQTPDRLVYHNGGSNLGLPPSFPSPVQLSLGAQALASVPPGQTPPAYLMPPHSQTTGAQEQSRQQLIHPQLHHHTSAELGLTVHHSMSAPDLLSSQLEQSMHLSTSPPATAAVTAAAHPPPPPPQLPSPPPHHQQQASSSSPPEHYAVIANEAFVPQAPTLTGPGCFTAQVLVPDAMIGSILGRGGRALTELQMLSGTRIRISQRGDYMPGTRSRIVTIRGQTAQSVWQAQYIMSQRMILPPTAVVNPASPLPTIQAGVAAAPLHPQQQSPSSKQSAQANVDPSAASAVPSQPGQQATAPSPSDTSSTTAPSSSASSRAGADRLPSQPHQAQAQPQHSATSTSS